MQITSESELIIRKSKWKLVCYALFAGILDAYVLIELYRKRSTFTIILGILFLAVFCFCLYELIKRKPEIILSKEGIFLRGAGFFTWDIVSSFSTADEGDDGSKLVLHFNNLPDEKISIEDLEVEKEELIATIINHKGNAKLYYKGHY